MSEPEWLKWIDPAPKDAEELADLTASIAKAVREVKEAVGSPDTAALSREFRAEARKFRAAAKALAQLPDKWANCSMITGLRKDLEGFAQSHDEFVKTWGPKRKGHPTDKIKCVTVMICANFLLRHMKNASTATTARFCRWVWTEANDRTQEDRPSDLDTWETTVIRSNKRLHSL
jgi:hypothetical protein